MGKVQVVWIQAEDVRECWPMSGLAHHGIVIPVRGAR